MLKAVIAKKRMELVDQRSEAHWLGVEYADSERRVCGLLTMAVASYRFQSTRRDSDDALRVRTGDSANARL